MHDELLKYVDTHFDTMFSYHPENRAKVVMYEKEVDCNRWQQSYLNTPIYDEQISQNSSYMFSGKTNDIKEELPPEFQTILNYVNKSENKPAYNQVTVNWYENGSDYIPYHSDYTDKLVPNTDILVVNLVKDENNLRKFCLKPKSSNKHAWYSRVEIPLYNGVMISMRVIRNKNIHMVSRQSVQKP
jgi:hypothetical protein